MSNLHRSSSETAAGARARLSVGGLLNRATRLALMLVLAALGLMLLQNFRTILRSSSAAPVARKGEASTASLQAEAGSRTRPAPGPFSLQQGAWLLGDNSWAVSLVDLSDAAGRARLRSLGSAAAGATTPSELEEQILRWLRQYRPVVEEGCRVYDVPLKGGAQARLVTGQQAERERLRLAQIIYRRAGAAQMLEASPAPHPTTSKPGADHLLPLPAGTASVARRWNGQRLACELLGPASLRECLRGWSAAGWTAETRETEGPISHLVLGNGERRIQLYSLQAGQAGSPAYLLLTAEQ